MEQMEELIKKSRAGDRQAQEALVQAAQDRVYYHCHKMLRNPEDALDATQEILISMLNGLDSLRKPAAFWGWLNRLTSNVCFRWISRGRRESLLWEDLADSAPQGVYENFDDQTVPDKALDNEETRRMVVELVESLPEAQRLSVLFYYYDEMSIKEIAEAMETTENTVKSRLHYAREAIRKGVDRYTAQGIKLYGLTPVPFLRYFLQKETVSTAAAIAGKAALAASAAAISAAGDAAVTAGMAKVLGGVLTRRGAAVLAGLALAGAITGGTLLRMDRPGEAEPLEREPAALTAVVPSSEPETPAKSAPPEEAVQPAELSPASELPPAPAEPKWTPPVWMGESPEPEEAGEPPLQETEQAPEEEELLETPREIPPDSEDSPYDSDDGEVEDAEIQEPEPTPKREERNDRTPGRDDNDNDDDDDDNDDDDDDDDDDGSGGVSPSPEPEQPPPAVSVQYEPDPDFLGDYIGQTAEGVHEFLYSVQIPDQTGGRCPLLPGEYYSRMEISNSTVAGTNGQRFWGFKDGETDIRFYVSEKEEGPYELKAVVHLQVFPMESIRPGAEYSISGYTPEGLPVIEYEMRPDGKDQPQPLVVKGFEVKLESSDPAVVGIRTETGRFYGVAPGYAEVRAYIKSPYVLNASWELQALFKLTVVQPWELTEGAKLCAPVELFSPGQGAAGCAEAAYQGVNAERGIYEFTASVQEGEVFQLRPLAEGRCEIRKAVSNDRALSENWDEDTYRAVEAGTADIIFYAGETPEGAFTECAVVHVTILPKCPLYDPNPDFGEFLSRDEQGIYHFRVKLEAGGSGLPCPLLPEPDYFRAVSEDPGTAAMRNGILYGISPGSTEVRYFFSSQKEIGYELRALASVEVTSPASEPSEPPEPSEPSGPLPIPPGAEVVERNLSIGYGYSNKLQNDWGEGDLPDSPEFLSSDPKIVCVNEQGYFTTMSPGTAKVMAWDPADPGVYYVLNVLVEDHFDWGVAIQDVEIPVGGDPYFHTFSFRCMYSGAVMEGVDWASSDPSVVTVSSQNTDQCALLGQQPGTATVTGTVRFSLVTAVEELVEMTDTVSFQVTVVP